MSKTIRTGERPDRRHANSARTRRDILAAAQVLATGEGLEALTIGRLAAEVSMSKGGVFAHFGSKEALQAATAEAAYEVFLREVHEPSLSAPPGLPRLNAVFEHYVRYIFERSDIGGCFFTAASLEFDDREGPVRELIRRLLEDRNARLARLIEEAVSRGHLPPKADQAHLLESIVMILSGAAVMYQMSKDRGVYVRARRLLDGVLAEALRLK